MFSPTLYIKNFFQVFDTSELNKVSFPRTCHLNFFLYYIYFGVFCTETQPCLIISLAKADSTTFP